MHSLHKKRGFSTLELCIVIFLIGVFILISAICYQRLLIRVKEQALETQLRNMRAYIAFFDSKKGRLPYSLRELGKTPLTKYGLLRIPSWDEEGCPLDPFGNRYKYDRKAGEVHSQTEGYDDW